MVTVDELMTALGRVHPRTTQVLLSRFVAPMGERDGRTRAEFASFYGLSESAADVLLWRAAIDFGAALEGRSRPPPAPFDHEQREAVQLGAALERGAHHPPLVEALGALTTHAGVIRERLAAAERAELTSPAYVRETWLRRIAIVIVLALSAWLWKDELLRRWAEWRGEPAVTRPSPPG